MGQLGTPEHFGDYLGALLKTHRLSAAQLAEATRLRPELIGQLLRGEQILTADVAFLLAEVFARSPLALLEVQAGGVLEARAQTTPHKTG